MPENMMVRGQICATLFPEDNNWHRGIITGKNEEGFIEVYYVDYGNINFVPKSTVLFLKYVLRGVNEKWFYQLLYSIAPRNRVFWSI